MTIIILADIHSRIDHIGSIGAELKNADVIVIAGDITNIGDASEAERIISAIQAYNSNILAIGGNCDRPAVDEYLKETNISLDRRSVNVNGVIFGGVSGSPSSSNNNPEKPGDDRFRTSLSRLQEQVNSFDNFVLVTHQPARGSTVDLRHGQHFGNEAITDFIAKNNPMLAISGHIHEAAGVDRIGPTTYINPGPFRNGLYAIVEISDKVQKAAMHIIE